MLLIDETQDRQRNSAPINSKNHFIHEKQKKHKKFRDTIFQVATLFRIIMGTLSLCPSTKEVKKNALVSAFFNISERFLSVRSISLLSYELIGLSINQLNISHRCVITCTKSTFNDTEITTFSVFIMRT